MLDPDERGARLPGKFAMTMRQGDVILHEQPGGGGHGDPFTRDLALIERDLADGKISRGYAEAATALSWTR